MTTEGTLMDGTRPEEKQLCLSCLVPNPTQAHFCADCGAPLSSHAAIGPHERIFAEGYVYRRAVEQPRKLIVVVGVWLLLTPLLAPVMVPSWHDTAPGVLSTLLSVFMLAIFLVVAGKTTARYFAFRRASQVRHESGH